MEESATGELPLWGLLLIPVAFFILFPIIWCFVLWILSNVGGWKRLAEHYRTESEPSGETFYGVSGKVGLTNYNHALNCTANQEGLFLEVSLLFRFAHSRLFIPWTEFRDVRRTRLIWLSFLAAKIGEPKRGSLMLETKVFEQSEGRRLLEDSNSGRS